MREAGGGFLGERLGTLMISDRQRKVAEVVDREGGDPFIPGGASALDSLLQRRRGALTVAGREQVAPKLLNALATKRASSSSRRRQRRRVREADRGGMVTLQQPEGRGGCEGSSALRGR